MTEVTLRHAQEAVDEYVRTVVVRYFTELSNLAQLVEEIREVARVMNRTYGDQSARNSAEQHDLADELADVLAIANQTGTDHTAAFLANLETKTIRDRNRHYNNPKLTDLPQRD
ncbi:MAG: pyrophosphatase [Chloroflexia bacterium]|nr:pyrophosphatase [Chloroflexia bacterium]